MEHNIHEKARKFDTVSSSFYALKDRSESLMDRFFKVTLPSLFKDEWEPRMKALLDHPNLFPEIDKINGIPLDVLRSVRVSLGVGKVFYHGMQTVEREIFISLGQTCDMLCNIGYGEIPENYSSEKWSFKGPKELRAQLAYPETLQKLVKNPEFYAGQLVDRLIEKVTEMSVKKTYSDIEHRMSLMGAFSDLMDDDEKRAFGALRHAWGQARALERQLNILPEKKV